MKRAFIYSSFLIMLSLIIVSCGSRKKLSPKKQTVYMQEQYEELKKQLQFAEVTMINDSVKVIFKSGVMFQVGASEIDSAIFPSFERFSMVLKNYELTRILVTGHTDNSGAEETNNTISKKRAESAKQLLIDMEVAPYRLFTWGMGSTMPVADNATEEGKSKNRRVEFVILYSEN